MDTFAPAYAASRDGAGCGETVSNLYPMPPRRGWTEDELAEVDRQLTELGSARLEAATDVVRYGRLPGGGLLSIADASVPEGA